MRALHDLARVTASFDDASLVPSAGLLAPAVLAQRLDLAGLIDRHVDLGDRAGAANRGAKALTLLGTMLAGGDSIDDCDLMRAARLPSLFTDLGYPSERTSPGRTLATACPRVADPESAGALADRAMLA